MSGWDGRAGASTAPALPGTLEALSAAFKGQDRWKEKSKGAVTLSMVGSCRRRAVFRAIGTRREFVSDESRAAGLGTAQHDWLLPRLAESLAEEAETHVERAVQWPTGTSLGTLHGRLDLLAAGRLIDLKTVGEHGLSRVLRFGVRPAHVGQTGGYALALDAAGERPREIEVLYVDRANGDAVALPVDVDDAMHAAEAWLESIEPAVDAGDPERAPRDEQGPGLSIVCDGCEFLRACWGKDAVRGNVGPQRHLLDGVERDAVASAVAEYERASTDEKDAKSRKAFARAILEGQPAGDYGPLRLGWTRGWAPKPVPDGKAAIARLEELGEPVPMTLDGGRSTTIRVRPVPPEAG